MLVENIREILNKFNFLICFSEILLSSGGENLVINLGIVINIGGGE